ncbi:DUF4062 domain-containing protein [Variovorax sp. J22R133]|uniref:DUF4062 domain-containing protein n=1 Tax=Variovorax brevis TaxID=3053503 RepID=UPI0025752634|nr:DUF4062 domain-containing protein [Variovorax sp. J22R133]MDM0110986.1 DUF4062 domain-containing protein [Variovorax sp. J22R133]
MRAKPMAQIAPVFVSSTSLDLSAERQAVARVLDGLRETKFVGMEHFGSRDESTGKASLDEVDRSELYIGIFAGRWGSGITHDEYRRARERRLHCLIYFKDEAAIDAFGPGGRDDDPAAAPRLADFKQELKRHHIVRAAFSNGDELAAQVAIDVHRWLFDVARPQAAAGRAGLLDAVVDFRPLIERELQDFAGRERLFDELTDFVARGPNGYFVFIADAGLGKTAWAAAVARRWDAPAYFCSVAENRVDPEGCLRHLCAELVLRWDLPYDHLPDNAGHDATWLGNRLTEAGAKARRLGQPLWLVLDGLDEADPAEPGRNTLRLPTRLPDNVYVLLTTRPGGYSLASAPGTRLMPRELAAGDAMQRDDITASLHAAWRRPEVARAAAAAKPALDEAGFVAHLLAAAEDNFMYLAYVLADIAEGVPGFRPLQAERLPVGLESYYAHFWARMGLNELPQRDYAQWTGLWRPVLALLGVAGEPVSTAWLADHAGRPADEIHTRVLQPWRRFLAGGRQGWRIVHKSFADFLGSRDELDLPAMHRAIAQRDLADASRWPRFDGYALRHLATHLRRAGEDAALLALVGDPRWFAAQQLADPSVAGFQHDVAQAWATQEAIDDAALTAGQPLPALAGELRCALTTATLGHRSSNHSPGLLAALVRHRHWTPAVAMRVIEAMPAADQRLEAYAALAPALDELKDVRIALQRVRTTSETFAWRAAMVSLLRHQAGIGDVEGALSEALGLADSEAAARSIAAICPLLEPGDAQVALVRLIELVAAECARRKLRGAFDTDDTWHLGSLQAALDAQLLPALRALEATPPPRPLSLFWPGALARATALRLVEAGDWPAALAQWAKLKAPTVRATAAAGMVRCWPEAQRSSVAGPLLTKLWKAAPDHPSPKWLQAMAEMTAFLPGGPRETGLERLVRAALKKHMLLPARTLAALEPWLTDGALRLAVELAGEIEDRHDRREALGALAVAFARLEGPEAALRLATRGLDSYDRADVLVPMLPRLVLAGHLASALQALGDLRHDKFLPDALAAIAPVLPPEAIDAALTKAEELSDAAAWSRAAGALAERLAVLGQGPRALAVLHRIKDRPRPLAALRGTAAWLMAEAGLGDEALAQSMALDTEEQRAEALKALVPVMPLAQWDALWERLAEAWQRAADERGAHAVGTQFNLEEGLLAMVTRWVPVEGALATHARCLRALAPGMLRAQLMLKALAGFDHAQLLVDQAIEELLGGAAGERRIIGYALRDLAPSLSRAALQSVLAWLDAHRNERAVMAFAGPEKFEPELLIQLGRLGDVEEARSRSRWLEPEGEVALAAALCERLPPAEGDAWAMEAVQALTRMHYNFHKVFAPLAQVLTAATLPAAEAWLLGLDKAEDRERCACAWVSRAADCQDLPTTVETVMGWVDEAAQAGGVAALAPHADAVLLRRFEAGAGHWPAEDWTRPALRGVALRWAALGERQTAVDRAIAMKDGEVWVHLAPTLDVPALEQALAHLSSAYVRDNPRARSAIATRFAVLEMTVPAMELALRSGVPEDVLTALEAVVRALLEAPAAARHAAWRCGLAAASTLQREQALSVARILLRLTRGLSRPGELSAITAAAVDVLALWP